MWSKSAVLVVVVLGGVLAAGSLGGFSGADPAPDPEALLADSADTLGSEPIEGVRVEVVQRGNRSERVTVAVAERPPNRSRRELLNVERVNWANRSSQSVGPDPPTVVVRNETDAARYYESEQRVVRDSLSEGYFPSEAQRFGILEPRSLGRYNLTYLGTQRVSGRQTRVVRITPSEERLAELSVEVGTGDGGYSRTIAAVGDEDWQAVEETWYVDTETEYPVQRTVRFLDEEGSVVALRRHTYTELTVGASVPKSRFTFEAPPEAEVERTQRRGYERLDDEATTVDAFGLDRAEISVPDGWERGTPVALPDADTQFVTYGRADGNETVTLTVTTDAPAGLGTASAEADIDGRQVLERNVSSVDGTLSGRAAGVVLTWRCGDTVYQLTTAQDATLLAEFADEIGCG